MRTVINLIRIVYGVMEFRQKFRMKNSPSSPPPSNDSSVRLPASNQHPVCPILHPITFRRLAFKGPSAVFILACQLCSSLLHPTSSIFLHIYSWLPRSLAANPPPVSDQGEDISKSKPFKCSS
ncbi:hypothetical protein GOODEAATRI_007846 [Goodea atripinnis]|uniref:Uncharacterized protein n=1 Tax=Goodea atripinnis TaxID=208336 RepID=A0ABV0NIB1_9TELE